MNYQYKFKCLLRNKTEYEEEFTFTTRNNSLVLAKKELDEVLQKEWGFITKQGYRNEVMRSDRYWSVSLLEVVVIK